MKMPKKVYDFSDVRKLLEKPGEAGMEVLEAFDALLDAAFIFSPLFCGPQCLLLLNVLDVKDRLINISKVVYNGVIKLAEPNHNARIEKLKAAYALISITAYLELLPDTIPESVVKILKKETPNINDIFEKTIGTPETISKSLPIVDYYADHAISFTEVKEHMLECYQDASNYFIKLIDKVYEGANEKTKRELTATRKRVEELPQKAINNYENQYIGLAIKFDDFALFAQINMLEKIDSVSLENKEAIKKINNAVDTIDIGFKKLNDIVNSIYSNFSDERVKKIVNDLRIAYTNTIQKPIIDQSEIKSEDEKYNLVFPKIKDAFIPQSYKSLTYDDEEIKIEDKQIWDSITEQHDLDNFFIRYLYSPDSVDYPLLILGQPGSGKSLLTKVLSAQLMSDSHTVIRIPLRDVNANEKISTLVANQINNDIDRKAVEGYADFAEHFSENPLIIILDGYDELLQAKGRVFYGYLDGVREFQEDQKSHNRPVRVIVTSRITLIDKAHIPLHTSVLRLMEFDKSKQDAWISIWNETNAAFFKENNISPFILPAQAKGKNNSILDLAEQPLLLLMLAIYDSDSNELAKNKNIKRTELYDKLIRRFVRRERQRYVDDFANKRAKEKERIIDEEVKRLGIVAIGMYNRKGVVIRSEQLEKDLDIFNAHRDDGSPQMETLQESESVLGGFFFIHQSKARDLEAHSTNTESAYEFLHNTFGEFLAADFILRNTIDTVVKFSINQNYNNSFDGIITSDWFYCLMFVPLFTRPVVIEMLREHLDRALKNNVLNNKLPAQLSVEDFITNLDIIVKNQLNMVLNKRKMPGVMSENKLFDSDMSLLGYLSTYSMNLILLMSALSKNGYTLNETDYYQANNRTQDNHPWDELVSLWKAWFLQSDLLGLSVVLKAQRVADTEILVKCNDVFESKPFKQPVDVLLCVSHALGDSFMTGLAGLHTQNFNEITGLDDVAEGALYSHLTPNVYLSYLVKMIMRQTQQLQSVEGLINHYNRVNTINEILNEINSTILDRFRETELDFDICHLVFDTVVFCLSHKYVYIYKRDTFSMLLKELLRRYGILSEKFIYQNNYITFDYLNYGYLINRRIYRFDDHQYFSLDSFARGYYTKHKLAADSLLNRVEKEFCDNYINIFLSVDVEHRIQFLQRSFNPSALDVMLETSPELCFYLLDKLLSFDTALPSSMVAKIFKIAKHSLDSLFPSYVSCLRIEAITSMLVVAKRINYDSFLDQAYLEILKQFEAYNPDHSSEILFYSPEVMINLIELLPQNIVSGIIPKMEIFTNESIYSERFHLIFEVDALVDYLRMLIRIYSSEGLRKRIVSNSKKCIVNLTKHFYFNVDLSKMTIEQINILQSCAELVKNEPLLQRIKAIRNL